MYLARSSPTVLTWLMDASWSGLQRPHSGTPRPPGASTPSGPLAAESVAAGAGLLGSEVMVHLGIQGALGERLLQVIEKAIRVKGRLGIGPSQELVQNGIRNTRLFAPRHVGAP